MRHRLFPIYFVIFMDNFGFSILFTLLAPLILLPDYGMKTAQFSVAAQNVILALTFAVFPLTQFLGAPIIGDFADHFGRRKALYITILGTAIGFLLSAFAIHVHSVTFLIISRFLTGFFAGNLSICLAAIADLSPDEKTRAKNYSYVTTIFGFSWIFAMIVGGYFADPKIMGTFGPELAFYITAGLNFLNLLAILIFFHETFEEKADFHFNFTKGLKNILNAVTMKGLRVYYLVYFFWVVGWGISIQWFPAYSLEVYHVSVASVTTWMIVLGITWILGSSALNHYLLKKMGSLSIANIGIIFTTILVFCASLFTWHWLFAVFYCAAAIFSAFTMCNTMNLISTSAPAEIQGKVMGLSQSTLSFGWIIGGILSAVVTKTHINALYPICAFMLLMALILLVGCFFLSKKRV